MSEAHDKATNGSKSSVSKAAIIDAAVSLADQIGLDDFTMRKLAKALGSAPMTLYYHIPSKETLVDEMVERVFAQITKPPEDADWKDAIRLRCASAREVMNRHWWAPPLMDSRTTPGPESLSHHNAVIGCFRRAGFSVSLTAHAYAIIDSFVYGFAFEESMLPDLHDDPEARESTIESMSDQLNSGSYPYVAELSREQFLRPDYQFGASFDLGLDLLIDGLDRAHENELMGR